MITVVYGSMICRLFGRLKSLTLHGSASPPERLRQRNDRLATQTRCVAFLSYTGRKPGSRSSGRKPRAIWRGSSRGDGAAAARLMIESLSPDVSCPGATDEAPLLSLDPGPGGEVVDLLTLDRRVERPVKRFGDSRTAKGSLIQFLISVNGHRNVPTCGHRKVPTLGDQLTASLA